MKGGEGTRVRDGWWVGDSFFKHFLSAALCFWSCTMCVYVYVTAHNLYAGSCRVGRLLDRSSNRRQDTIIDSRLRTQQGRLFHWFGGNNNRGAWMSPREQPDIRWREAVNRKPSSEITVLSPSDTRTLQSQCPHTGLICSFCQPQIAVVLPAASQVVMVQTGLVKSSATWPNPTWSSASVQVMSSREGRERGRVCSAWGAHGR